MTQHCGAHPTGQKWLAGLLLVAVALMGLTITQQQALGSLHSHADQGPRLSPALRAAIANATRLHDADAHSHDSLEHHHHAVQDESVVALDGAAELANAADSPVSGALRGLGYPQRAAPAAASKRLRALPVPGGGATAPATWHTCSLSALWCAHVARLHVDPGWYRPYSNFFPG